MNHISHIHICGQRRLLSLYLYALNNLFPINLQSPPMVAHSVFFNLPYLDFILMFVYVLLFSVRRAHSGHRVVTVVCCLYLNGQLCRRVRLFVCLVLFQLELGTRAVTEGRRLYRARSVCVTGL